ncbi:hypothetical protein FRB94_009750 [Tulasnella sp. JGI-2019a]|nr:hypothetical protein FRB94_009750 [Tulasnella sp. JGI-2019a]
MSIGEDSNTLDRLIPLIAVSRGLRHFIQVTPSFWNVIGITKPNIWVVRRALERNGDLPLKIYLDAKYFNPESYIQMEQMLSVRTALFPVSHRIAILSFVDFWSHGINSFTEGLVAPNLHTFHSPREHPEHETLQYNPPLTLMNLTLVRFTLQRTAISPGSLRTLHLVSTSFSHTLGLGTLLEVLRNSPSLETLSLELIRGLGAPVERGVVELPKLRSLSLSQIRVNAFKTLCGAMHTPSLQTTRIRFIKSIEDRFDGSWLGSILDPREPSSVFIGRWLQQAPKITLETFHLDSSCISSRHCTY